MAPDPPPTPDPWADVQRLHGTLRIEPDGAGKGVICGEVWMHAPAVDAARAATDAQHQQQVAALTAQLEEAQDALRVRGAEDWALLLETNGEAITPSRIAAFLRLYAARLRANERWDIPQTMAAAYESGAAAIDRYGQETEDSIATLRAQLAAHEAAITRSDAEWQVAWDGLIAERNTAYAALAACQQAQALLVAELARLKS